MNTSSENSLFNILLVFLILSIVDIVKGYELHLDRGKDVILWKFRGHYLYTPKGEDLEGIYSSTTGENIFPPAIKEDGLEGLWLTKFTPKRENKLIISYMLKHALFTQGWIRFLADRNTSVLVKTNNEKVLGRFWSNGTAWCDVVINIGLQTMIILETETPNPGNYFLLDKIILGIFSNVSALNGRTLNPCSREQVKLDNDHYTTLPIISTQNRLIDLPIELEDSNTLPLEIVSVNSSSELKERNTFGSKVFNETMGVGERRNTRHSSLPGNEEGWTLENSSSTTETDLIEFDGTSKPVDMKVEDKLRPESRENDRKKNVTRMTLKPPTKKKTALRLHLTNNSNNTTLMDNLDLELPSSDGIISSSSSSSLTRSHSNTNQSLPSSSLDLKCECTCSCKKP